MRAIANRRTGLVLQGRYRLETELGTGSSARVFLAEDTRLHRPVAVKILHPALSDDETFVRRFRLEARAAASLNHPNIVHVYDWGFDTEGFYVVLEYLAGGSMRDLLSARGTISVPQAASIGVAIAQALAFAHERGIVHRDIKPANLLFDETGNPHIADFGLAKALSEASWTEPNGLVLGTARYASPEQALGQHLDDRSDVYSLGIVLYEAITGWSPFAGESLHALLVARVGNELPPTPELGPLESVIDAATRSDRGARLSALELAERLERAQRDLQVAEPIRPVGVGAFEERDVSRDGALFAPEPSDDITVLDTRTAARASASKGGGHSKRVPPNAGRRTRKRWVRLGLVGTVLLVLIAGGFYTITRFLVFSHVVPNVVHDELSAARGEVAAHGLRLRVADLVYSATVPSGEVTSESPRPGTREKAGVRVDVVVSKGPELVTVPIVAGDSKSVALRKIKDSHLVAVVATAFSESVPGGRVISASPAKGSVRFGTKVDLSVSLGPHPRTIPQFVSTTYLVASDRISALKLVPVEKLVYSNSVPAGDVLLTRPAGGTTGVTVGSQVTIVVSKGPRLVTVPTVANLPIATAVALLRRSGLIVNEQIGPPFATKATTTNPGPGARVRPGTAVTLYAA